MIRRELRLAFRARITWLAASACAFLVGHGFVLAIDIYSSASRSASASTLMRREMDPLAGIVRPTLGGLELAVCLLVPLVAARVLSVDRERGAFGALALQVGSIHRLVAAKLVAAFLGASLALAGPVAALVVFVATGGHLDAIETATALFGHVLHLLFITTASIAAAAWTRTLGAAAAIGVLLSLASWGIDAAEGYAAVAWLGAWSRWSTASRLAAFEHGVLSLASMSTFVVAILGATALAMVGAAFDRSRRWRAASSACLVVAVVCGIAGVDRARRAFDWSEQARASLPPAAVAAVRAIDAPIAIDVWLSAEDSRRRQLETDVLAKLRLARSDLVVRMPLDDSSDDAGTGHDDDRYGTVVLHVGAASRETRSASRREIVTVLLETAGRGLPDWTMPEYPGYPLVLEGGRRTAVAVIVYVVVPGALLMIGLLLTRPRSRRSK